MCKTRQTQKETEIEIEARCPDTTSLKTVFNSLIIVCFTVPLDAKLDSVGPRLSEILEGDSLLLMYLFIATFLDVRYGS
jgi:hypothetical protein